MTVRAPVESLQTLIATVGQDFPQAVNLLENALRRVNAGQTSAACDALDAFLNQVAAQAGKSLSIADALQLTLQGAGVQAALGCSSPSP